MKEVREQDRPPQEVADFDLLVDGWIPVHQRAEEPVRPGAEPVVELGLLELLRQAHRLEGIADASPLQTVGLYRFLAAVVHRYLHLEDERQWAAAWTAGRFDDAFLDRVSGACRDRLRLFDRRYPFLQTGDVDWRSLEPKHLASVGYLAPEESTGTNVIHFSHAGDQQHAFCAVCCAKGLVTVPAFATAGGAGIMPSINGVPPVYVMPLGESLYATLMLNFVLPAFRPRAAAGKDPGPLWESDGVVPARQVVPSVGFCQSLTWPARRIRLVPQEGGSCSRCGRPAPNLVRRMLFQMGLSRPKDASLWDDPWVAFRARKATGDGPDRVPVRPQEGKELWRDFGSLFLTSSQQQAERPLLLQQIDVLQQGKFHKLDPKTPLRFLAVGLRTDMKAKVFEWRKDYFHFPAALLLRSRSHQAVQDALELAEEVSRVLRRAVRRLHPITERARPDADAAAKALESLNRDAQAHYWRELGVRFRALLLDERLRGQEADRAAWASAWREDLREVARSAFEDLLESYDDDAESLRRQQTARAVFFAGLRKALEGPHGSDH